MNFPSKPSADRSAEPERGDSGIWRRSPDWAAAPRQVPPLGDAGHRLARNALGGLLTLLLLAGLTVALGYVLVALTERLSELGRGEQLSSSDD